MAHFKVKDGYESSFQDNHSLSLSDRVDADGVRHKGVGHDDPDQVGCIVLLRKGEDTLPCLTDVEAKVKELNDPASGRMLPGVEIVPYYDRRELTNVTTDTVVENLAIGVGLVSVVLLTFLSNVKTALIVAINIPLALLFAFSHALLPRQVGEPALDRRGGLRHHRRFLGDHRREHLSPPGQRGEHADIPLKTRIFRAAGEIDHALLFSTLIMVCAFIPLFTLEGPAGALFGPMAQTYASALAGALVLALMLSPVLCLLLLHESQAGRRTTSSSASSRHSYL